MTNVYLPLAAMALLLAACTEKEPVLEPAVVPENAVQEVTKKNLVGTYLVTKVESAASGKRSDITTTWFSSYAGECAKDDITEFKPDDSFVVQDGRIECDESTDDNGTWSLINKTRLKIDADTATIEELTTKTLRIVSPIYSTSQGAIIFTYTRQ
ncbi:MAG TPA: lipocalin family protein [Chitinophagaceae bacterium]|nr:lipocalin family protein [Chitinophagaceae bacterium]